MRNLHVVSFIVAFFIFGIGSFFSLGPNDTRALGMYFIFAAAIFAAATVLGASLDKGRSHDSR